MNPWQAMYGKNWRMVRAVYFLLGCATVTVAIILGGHQMGFL